MPVVQKPLICLLLLSFLPILGSCSDRNGGGPRAESADSEWVQLREAVRRCEAGSFEVTRERALFGFLVRQRYEIEVGPAPASSCRVHIRVARVALEASGAVRKQWESQGRSPSEIEEEIGQRERALRGRLEGLEGECSGAPAHLAALLERWREVSGALADEAGCTGPVFAADGRAGAG